MRTKVEKAIELGVGRPDGMPDCFGKEFEPTDAECLQCKAFYMCAYFRLKDYPDGYLDQVRELSDNQVRGLAKDHEDVKELIRAVAKEMRLDDLISAKNRVIRFIRDNKNVDYEKGKITVW